MMVKLNFVWESWQIDKLEDKDFVILLEDCLETKLKEKGIEYKRFEDYLTFEELDALNKESIFWLKEWANSKKFGGKSFKELFESLGFSLWWYIDFWVFYHETHIITIKEACKFINVVEKIIETEKPSSVVVYDGVHYYNKLLRSISNKNNVVVKSKRAGFKNKFNLWYKFEKPYFIEFLKRSKFLFRWVFSKLYGIKPMAKQKQILFGSFSYNWRKEFNRKTNSLEERDFMVSDIMDVAVKEGYNPLLIDIDYSPSKSFKSISERKEFSRPFESYFDFSLLKRANKENKKNLKIYKKFKELILNSLVYKGINLREVFDRKFDFAVKQRFKEAILDILIWEKIIEKESPNSVLAIDEFGLFGRSANAAAYRKKINSVGMQHGMVGENSYEYQFLTEEIGGEYNFPKAVLPNYLTTFGDITRNFLINQGYNPDKIVKVGQPRYDVLNWIKINFDKKKLKSKLGLPMDRKIVFFASQPIPGNEKITYELMKSLSGVEGICFVVKTHPREYDLEFYYKYAKEFGINFKLFKGDLYELLFCSDLLITKNSTVALEAMVLDIPVITTNLIGLPDIFPFGKFNCTLQIDDASLYKESITGLLFKTEKIKELLEKQKKFLFDYLYKVDGKASERILKILIS